MPKTRIRLAVATVAALLLACQEAAPPEDHAVVASDEVVGGTRLKARWVAGPDGPVAPVPWDAPFLDETLGASCDFGLATDGVLRCLAGHRRGAMASASPGHLARWSDPDCTVPVVDLTPGCQPSPTWRAWPASMSCPATVVVRRPGVKLAPGTAIYERTLTGCAVAAVSAGAEDWTLVEEDPATFAAAVEEDGPSGGGFTVRRIVSEDGARLAIGLRPDGERWAGVPAEAADGSIRLLPPTPRLWTTGGSADEACTAPAMTGEGCIAPGDIGQTWRARDACHGGVTVFTVGPRLDVLYGGPACTGAPAGTNVEFAVTERPIASLPEATPAAPRARLQQGGFRIGDRWQWRQGQVLDAALGEAVRATLAEDGLLRWLPNLALGFTVAQGAADTWAFANPACTERLLSYPSALCLTPGRWALAGDLWSCGAPFTAWTTEPWAGAGLFTRTGPEGACLAAAPDAARRYVLLLAPAAPDTFAPAGELLR